MYRRHPVHPRDPRLRSPVTATTHICPRHDLVASRSRRPARARPRHSDRPRRRRKEQVPRSDGTPANLSGGSGRRRSADVGRRGARAARSSAGARRSARQYAARDSLAVRCPRTRAGSADAEPRRRPADGGGYDMDGCDGCLRVPAKFVRRRPRPRGRSCTRASAATRTSSRRCGRRGHRRARVRRAECAAGRCVPCRPARLTTDPCPCPPLPTAAQSVLRRPVDRCRSTSAVPSDAFHVAGDPRRRARRDRRKRRSVPPTEQTAQRAARLERSGARGARGAHADLRHDIRVGGRRARPRSGVREISPAATMVEGGASRPHMLVEIEAEGTSRRSGAAGPADPAGAKTCADPALTMP